MKIDDNFYMKLAIDEAWKFQLITYPNPAVGAVVVKNGVLLSIEAHKEAGEAHAEVLALKSAYLKIFPNDNLKMIHGSAFIHTYLIKNHNGFFNDCEIYVTLEPCNHVGKTPSCAELISELGLKRVIISQKDINKEASNGIETLKSANIDISIDCLVNEGEQLLLPFLKWSQGTFIFYKMAQTINGTIDGGKISSNQALAYVHALREKIDLLLIGGNTVRVDKPTLDARFIGGRAPNVMIYTKNKVFDTSIPLFKIPDRKVIISDDLFKLLDYKFIMVEGGYNLLDILKERIDYLVLLISPKMRVGLNATLIDLDYKIIHENYIGKEKIVYLEKI